MGFLTKPRRYAESLPRSGVGPGMMHDACGGRSPLRQRLDRDGYKLKGIIYFPGAQLRSLPRRASSADLPRSRLHRLFQLLHCRINCLRHRLHVKLQAQKMPTYSSNLGKWISDPDPRAPHFAAPLDCACLGCRTFGMGGGTGGGTTGHVVYGSDGKPLAPLPQISKDNGFIAADDAAKLDRQVLECFAESYLAPLLPMTRSANWEIRRGAITSIARLSDNQLRAAVSALRNLKGRSVLADVLGFCMSEMCTMPQRREAGARDARDAAHTSPRAQPHH